MQPYHNILVCTHHLLTCVCVPYGVRLTEHVPEVLMEIRVQYLAKYTDL